MDDRSPLAPDELPEDLVQFIKPELQPGERLLWASRAGRGRDRHRKGHATSGTWAFGLTAVAIACIVLSTRSDLPIRQVEAALITFGIVFGLIGLVIGLVTVAALTSDSRRRRLLSRRIYALTDRRAIVWAPLAGSDAVTVHVYPRGSIKPGQIERTQFPDGSGSLALLGGYSAVGNFEGIAEVRRVEELVRRFLVDPGPEPSP